MFQRQVSAVLLSPLNAFNNSVVLIWASLQTEGCTLQLFTIIIFVIINSMIGRISLLPWKVFHLEFHVHSSCIRPQSVSHQTLSMTIPHRLSVRFRSIMHSNTMVSKPVTKAPFPQCGTVRYGMVQYAYFSVSITMKGLPYQGTGHNFGNTSGWGS